MLLWPRNKDNVTFVYIYNLNIDRQTVSGDRVTHFPSTSVIYLSLLKHYTKANMVIIINFPHILVEGLLFYILINCMINYS